VIGIRFQVTKLQILHGITNEEPRYFIRFWQEYCESYEHCPARKEQALNNSRFHWGNYRSEYPGYTEKRSHSRADEDCHNGGRIED